MKINLTTTSNDKITYFMVLGCWISEMIDPDRHLDQVYHTLPTWHEQHR